jgi:hypothetical protein
MVLRPEDDLVGRSYRTTTEANNKLRVASEQYNLIAPATRVGSLPPGCGVAMSLVTVDPRFDQESKQGPDVYVVDGGKLALQKHVLDRFASALGVSWDPRESRRLDDGSHPHYCAYRAAGVYRDFSGRVLSVSGEYELDLRDGSERAKGATSKNLGSMRKFIVSRAETGARSRAISSAGIKRAYTAEELKKPFVIASLHFDGHSDDPETQRLLTQETARAFHAACTPEFYVFDGARRLSYHGRFDASTPGNNVPCTGDDLRAALDAALTGQAAPQPQHPSMGCNIKWK